MREAKVKLESLTPLSWSRYHDTPKNPNESAKDYEERTWRERMHIDDSGQVFIPPMALKNALVEYAKFSGKKVTGRGNATWTKHFEAGGQVMDRIETGVHKDQLEVERLFVPADGVKGGPKRVHKCFPLIRKWASSVSVYIVDPTITKDVLQEFLTGAGRFIGLGRFRFRNGGYYGGFSATITEWGEDE